MEAATLIALIVSIAGSIAAIIPKVFFARAASRAAWKSEAIRHAELDACRAKIAERRDRKDKWQEDYEEEIRRLRAENEALRERPWSIG